MCARQYGRYRLGGDERNRRRASERAADGLESETQTLLGRPFKTGCAESTDLSYERPRFHRANGEGLRLGSGCLGFFVPHSGWLAVICSITRVTTSSPSSSSKTKPHTGQSNRSTTRS